MTTIRPGNYISNIHRLFLAFLNIGRHTFQDNLKFIFKENEMKLEYVLYLVNSLDESDADLIQNLLKSSTSGKGIPLI